jgi:hypothetical protein
VAITAAPYRESFMAKIAGSEKAAMPALADISPSFSASVAMINQFLMEAGLEK